MADSIVPVRPSPEVSRRMALVRTRDTSPEVALRRILHGRGLRYRVHFRPMRELRRHADIVFPSLKVAVFVDGCFWHGCPEHATWPKTNGAWWRGKLERNRARDVETVTCLVASGWLVIRVWEHEAADEAAGRIAEAVALRRAGAERTRRRGFPTA